MAYISESPSRRRRRRRQQVTMAVLVLLVLGVGGAAYAYFEGMIGRPPVDVGVAAPPPCPTGKTPAVRPREVHVNVYNATSRSGLAAGVAKALRARTFVVETVANDPARKSVRGTAEVRYGRVGAAGAALVAAQVPGARLVPDKRRSGLVDLVLGVKYRSLRPVATTAPTPTGSSTPCSTPTTSGPSSSTVPGRTSVPATKP